MANVLEPPLPPAPEAPPAAPPEPAPPDPLTPPCWNTMVPVVVGLVLCEVHVIRLPETQYE
jgi:hypothetical protein